MGILDIFKKKEELPEKDRKWNRMWDMWANGEVESPYSQLMTYESEVINGGHVQYFDNTDNICDLKTEVDIAAAALPEPLKGNLLRAYEAYLVRGETWKEQYDEVFSECDDAFYEHEKLLIAMLETYAETMKL